MIGYSGLEVFDVFLFDSFIEGYKVDDSTLVLPSWIQSIQVYENINFLFPSMKIVWTDRASAYFDKRHTSELLIQLGYDKNWTGFWDFAVSSRRGDRGLTLTHQSEMKRNWYGYDMLGIWFSEKKTRGFKGVKAASDVAEEVGETILNKYLDKVGDTFYMKVEMDLEPSADRVSYLQLGESTTKFLYYLRDKAISRDGSGYVCWIERRGFDREGRTNDLQFNFLSIQYLIEQDVQWYIEFDPSSKSLEETKKNGGLLKKNPPTLLALNIGVGSTEWKPTEKIGKVSNFDLNKLKFNIQDYKFVNETTKISTNILDGYLRQLNEMNSYINIGGTDGKEIGTDFAHAFRNKFSRRVYILVVGHLGLRIGDKVRVMVPTVNSEMIDWISGDWIVGSITHFFSFPEMKYFMKLGLVSDAFPHER